MCISYSIPSCLPILYVYFSEPNLWEIAYREFANNWAEIKNAFFWIFLFCIFLASVRCTIDIWLIFWYILLLSYLKQDCHVIKSLWLFLIKCLCLCFSWYLISSKQRCFKLSIWCECSRGIVICLKHIHSQIEEIIDASPCIFQGWRRRLRHLSSKCLNSEDDFWVSHLSLAFQQWGNL